MIPRLHVPLARDGAGTVTLPADEQHYLRAVLRLSAGARLRVFDGAGHEWSARVVTAARHEVILALEERVMPAPEPGMAVTLALAVLKSEYMDEAVRDAVMLGAARLQPLITARAVLHRGDGPRGAVERWRRIALAAVRQSGRAVTPHVLAPERFDAWIASQRDVNSVKLLLCEPRLRAPAPLDLAPLRAQACDNGVVLLAGPEGGWEEDETVAAREAGFTAWTVSRRTLRADAMPVAALSVLFYAWDLG